MSNPKPKVILAGFLKCGTKSYDKKLSEHYDVLRLDTDLYCRFINVPKVLRATYGDVPIYFIARKNETNLIQSLKRTYHLQRLRKLTTLDIDYIYDYLLHIGRFRKYFSNVNFIYMEDQDMPHEGKSTLKHKLAHLLPLWILKIYRNNKYKYDTNGNLNRFKKLGDE